MFGFLKKKISDFVQTVSTSAKSLVNEPATENSTLATDKVEQKPTESSPAQVQLPAEEQSPVREQKPTEQLREKLPAVESVKSHEVVAPKTSTAQLTEKQKLQKPQPPKPVEKTKPIEKPQSSVISEVELKPKPVASPIPPLQAKTVDRQEKAFAPQVGIFKKITGIFSSDVELTEKDVGNVFDDMELSLLESDASLDTAQFMVSDLRSRLIGKKIQKNKLNDYVQAAVRDSLLDIFANSTPSRAFFKLVEQHKKTSEPLVVLFVGPNGAGKTTTIAKLAHLLKQRGISSVISASDTFRAAAIQQSEHHGEKIGVKVIKHDYGSDPAAVAFDAVSHAKAKKIDVVLIDTAGRQETNVNLIEEMKKISRVVKPNLKIFIGETLAGHSVIEQAKKFHEAIQLDGLVLTKLDCDAKGGNCLSIAHDLSIPIYFVGLGQEYNELVEFKPELLVSRILAE